MSSGKVSMVVQSIRNRFPTQRPAFLAGAVFLLCFSLALSSSPSHLAAADAYTRCVAYIDENADASYDRAMEWYAQGGGAGALHCSALALSALGLYEAAAARFEEIAVRRDAGSEVERAQILSQAGDAWTLAGKYDRAVASLTSAMDLLPRDLALRLSRARVLIIADDLSAAITDLDGVLAERPAWGEAYLLRGRAQRLLGKLRFAAADLELSLQNGGPEIPVRLERGLVRQALGDKDGAREDWIYVQGQTGEKDPAGVASRSYLEQMDVRVDR